MDTVITKYPKQYVVTYKGRIVYQDYSKHYAEEAFKEWYKLEKRKE